MYSDTGYMTALLSSTTPEHRPKGLTIFRSDSGDTAKWAIMAQSTLR